MKTNQNNMSILCVGFEHIRKIRYLNYCACHKTEPEASEVQCLITTYQVPNLIMTTLSQNDRFKALKTSSKFTKHCGLAIQCYLRRDRLSLTHTCQRSLALCTKNYACQRAKKCPKPCSCHTKRGSDPDLLCLHKKHIVSQTDTARR